MRLFRDEEAARKAGCRSVTGVFFGPDGSVVKILNDRERALLEALEKALAIAAAGAKGTDESAVANLEEFVNSLNVEG